MYYLKWNSSVEKLLFLVVKVGNLLRNIYLKIEMWTWILCFFPQNLLEVGLFHHTAVPVKAVILCSTDTLGLWQWRRMRLDTVLFLSLAVDFLDAHPELISPELKVIKTREQ